MRTRLRSARGQSLLEFAIVAPLLLLLALGVIEIGYALLDQHVVTKLTREGSNLISRDSTIQQAVTALTSMSTAPVNFATRSKVIFSVIRNGATVGTANFGRDIVYQRHEHGNLADASSRIRTQGTGSYRGAPDYEAVNPDTTTALRVIAASLPDGLTLGPGDMVYVTEVYTQHTLLTPVSSFGLVVPERLYSIAYF